MSHSYSKSSKKMNLLEPRSPIQSEKSKEELLETTSNNLQNGMSKKCLYFVLTLGGYRSYPDIYPKLSFFWRWFIIVGYMLTNCVTICVSIKDSPFCGYFNACIILFQFNSLISYFCALYCIDNEFTDALLSAIKENENKNENSNYNKQNKFKMYQCCCKRNALCKKICQTAFVFLLLPYLTGLALIPHAFETYNNGWKKQIFWTNIADILRYIPNVLQIAFVKLIYDLFERRIERFQTNLNLKFPNIQLTNSEDMLSIVSLNSVISNTNHYVTINTNFIEFREQFQRV